MFTWNLSPVIAALTLVLVGWSIRHLSARRRQEVWNRENRRLREMLVAARRDARCPAPEPSPDQGALKATSEVLQLQQRLQEIQPLEDRVLRLDAELHEAHERQQTLERELNVRRRSDEATAGAVAELRALLDSQSTELQLLEDDRQRLREHLQETTTRLTTQAEQSNAYRAEVSHWQDRSKALALAARKLAGKLNRHVAMTNRQVAGLKKRLAIAEHHAAVAKRQVAELRERLAVQRRAGLASDDAPAEPPDPIAHTRGKPVVFSFYEAKQRISKAA